MEKRRLMVIISTHLQPLGQGRVVSVIWKCDDDFLHLLQLDSRLKKLKEIMVGHQTKNGLFMKGKWVSVRLKKKRINVLVPE
jgi:hypothetical protein